MLAESTDSPPAPDTGPASGSVTSSAEVAAGGEHPAATMSIALALAVGVWSGRDWIAVEEEVEDDPSWVLLCMPNEEPLREPSPSVVPCSWWTEDREG